MKRCPECNRSYTDETLNFCLDDGEWLVDGRLSGEESKTAILRSPESPSEAATKLQIRATDQADALPTVGGQRQMDRKAFRTRFVLTAGLAIVIAVAGFFGYRHFASSSKEIRSIAVLPFENGTGDPGMDYLSDGLSEELVDKFSQLPDLKVIARQSSFKYRGPNVDLADVANKLGVGAVVTGRLTKQGDQLTVRAELIDVRENKQLWGEQYTRKASDAMNIRQEIAANVASSLRPRLTGAQQQQFAKKGTTNPEAYELLLKGKFSMEEGQQFFEQAVAVDPNYPEAWARLAAVYIIRINDGADPERLAKAEAAARKALQLDDSLPVAHQAYADWLVTQWNWGEAEAEYRRAIDLDPNSAHGGYARLLSLVGRNDEAVREAARNRELNPVGPFAHNLEGVTLFFARRYDEAIQASQRAIDLETWSNFYLTLGNSYAGKKMYREAIEAYLHVAQPTDIVWVSKQIHLGAAYANIGQRDKALAILKELQTTERYVSPAELPVLLIALGMKDEAFASFEKAIEEHDLRMGYLKVEPQFDPLRGDPRFQEILKKVGFPQ